MSQRLCAIEKEATELFGEMRNLTKEEIEIRDKMYDDMSTPTGANFFDLLDKSIDEA